MICYNELINGFDSSFTLLDKSFFNKKTPPQLKKHTWVVRSFPARWIKKTIEIINALNLKHMVEIGTIRVPITDHCVDYFENNNIITGNKKPQCCEGGHSTYFWSKYTKLKKIYTVDIDPYTQTIIKKTFPTKPKNLIPIIDDGVLFCQKLKTKIDFLYLDGWDINTYNYKDKHLQAYLAIKDKFNPLHIVSIDDTDFAYNKGKDGTLTPYLLDNNYTQLLSGRQKLFIKQN